jgi:hypothetical protein
MRVEADDRTAERAADRLLALAEAHGAQMAREAVLRVVGTDAWIAVPQDARPGGLLVAMPPELLPDVERAHLRLDGDDLVVADPGPQPTASQATALQAMVDLFNALGRPAQWRRRSPWQALAGDPAVLDHLLAGRALGEEGRRRRRMLDGGDRDGLLLRSFLSTRTYPLAGGGVGGGWASLLMPLLDLLDHDWRARPFHRRPLDVGRSVICAHPDRPVPDSDACYVQYSALDALTSLLLYGFVDRSSPIANSVPTELQLSDGAVILVRGEPVGPADSVPRHLRDVALHVPTLAAAGPDRLAAAFLICAGANAAAARVRVLEDLVDRLRPDLGARRRADEAAAAAAQLHAANLAFHRRTLELVDTALCATPPSPAPGRDAVLQAARAGALQDLAHLQAQTDPA